MKVSDIKPDVWYKIAYRRPGDYRYSYSYYGNTGNSKTILGVGKLKQIKAGWGQNPHVFELQNTGEEVWVTSNGVKNVARGAKKSAPTDDVAKAWEDTLANDTLYTKQDILPCQIYLGGLDVEAKVMDTGHLVLDPVNALKLEIVIKHCYKTAMEES
jgi:hypothetical protein